MKIGRSYKDLEVVWCKCFEIHVPGMAGQRTKGSVHEIKVLDMLSQRNMENEFHTAFSTPITMAQNVNLENEMGTMQKPHELMNIEEYNGWEEHFKNWVQANHLEAWECVEQGYVRLIDEYGNIVAIKYLDDKEKKKYKSEKMMISILQQAIKEDILILLQHNGSAHSMWKALKMNFVGSLDMIKNKKSLLKKEFDLFHELKTENTKGL